MASIPNRLQPDTPLADNLALINDNFDKTAQDISDFGAKFSSVATYTVVLPAGSLTSQSIGVVDTSGTSAQYVIGRLQIVPRVEVFVDTPANDAFLLGYINSLTNGQANAMVSIWPQRRATSGTIATFEVQIKNFDSASHTYYVNVDESLIASPATGNFR